jgi:hypothetical protein
MIDPVQRPVAAWFARNWDMLALCILAIWALGFILLVDVDFGPGPLSFYLGYAGVCSIVLFPLAVWRRRRAKLVTFVMFWVLILTVWAIPWNSRKAFFRDFRTIKPGMTIAQVEAKMRPYIRDAGRDTDASKRVYRHCDDMYSERGQDYGEVQFKNGKVVSTRENWGD